MLSPLSIALLILSSAVYHVSTMDWRESSAIYPAGIENSDVDAAYNPSRMPMSGTAPVIAGTLEDSYPYDESWQCHSQIDSLQLPSPASTNDTEFIDWPLYDEHMQRMDGEDLAESSGIDIGQELGLAFSYGGLGESSLEKGPEDDYLTSEYDKNWYATVANRYVKTKVTKILSHYWYHSTGRNVSDMTRKHIISKLNSKEFEKIYRSHGDVRVLERITSMMKKKYGDAFQPTHVQFDADDNVLPKETSDVVMDGLQSPAWYVSESRIDKINVISKMSQLLYGSIRPKHKDLTRYLIIKRFTPEDYAYILHSSCNVEDSRIQDIVERTRRGRGRPQVYHMEAASISSPPSQDEEDDGSASGNWDQSAPWYKAQSADDKQYVITRMTYFWYKAFDDVTLRRRTRARIARYFTLPDFLKVLDPDTDYETISEIAHRCSKDDPTDWKKALIMMRKGLAESGIMSIRTAERYCKDAIEKEGYADKTVDEIEARIVERWIQAGQQGASVPDL